jgi:hypothetical protein
VDLERKKSAVPSRKLPRRSHSDAEVPFRRVRQLSVSQLPRVTLQRAVMVTRAVVRMKFLTTNTPTDTEEEASPVLSPRPPCGSLYCAYAREKGPLVVQCSLLVFDCRSPTLWYRSACQLAPTLNAHGRTVAGKAKE